MRDRANRLEVADFQGGVRHALAEERAGLAVDGRGEVARILGVHEAHLDAELRQELVEHGEGPAVERAGGYDVVALACQVDDAVVDG